MNKKENILIVSYQFCPRGRIGTRRWSKFAKYLSEEYRVHVISAKYPYQDKINWCSDVINNKDIIIHRIKPMYPSYAIKEDRTFAVKALSKSLSVFPYYIDEAQFWKVPLHNKIDELRSKYSVKTIIGTGAPFSVLYHLAKYKELHESIKLIVDLRDPWMQLLKKQYTFLSKYKKRNELKFEKFTLTKADHVIVVTKSIMEEYVSVYPDINHKISTIYNGYDPQDFEINNTPCRRGNTTMPLRIAYAGAIFIDRAKGFKLFLDKLFSLNSNLSGKLIVEIYSSQVDESFKNYCKKNFDSVVKFQEPLPQNILFKELRSKDFLLSINAENAGFAFGTKIFEYFALGVKIILISPKGELFNLLSSSSHLVSDYSDEELERTILKLFNNFESLDFSLQEKFNIEMLTKELIFLITGKK